MDSRPGDGAGGDPGASRALREGCGKGSKGEASWVGSRIDGRARRSWFGSGPGLGYARRVLQFAIGIDLQGSLDCLAAVRSVFALLGT